ncbi:hypothetical protein [Paenibacillus glycinis]|uniref:DUF2178 domain-containing protein n=1 Tax=Paenibacillus glycinis TaxID=2697035 RepID=A0ABW9XWU7_9BACL|nr:hypothetical protein [Paenibacillus glycinis]NBD27165.1 hypothetical protein [Paenibacillus glycinis]
MSYQEKKHLVNGIGSLLLFAVYCWFVLQRHEAGSFDSTASFRFWAAAILILIPLSIAAKIILTILFNIVYRMTDREKEPSFSDERDKLIGLKATRNSHYAFVLGFLLSLGSLILNAEPSAMFVMLMFAGVASELVGAFTQLYLYRKGF